MKLSVYIPCRNGAATLPEVFAAIAHQTRPPDECLFVDDESTDGSAELAARAGFAILHQTKSHGLAAGRNLALASATGDVLVGIDADAVPAPTYLAEVERAFERHPQVGALCGRLDERYTTELPDAWRSIHMRQHHGDRQMSNPRFLYGATTAVKVAAARHTDGWNPRFVSNYEDVDFSERLRRAGIETLYEPRIAASHLRRDSLATVLTGFWKWFRPKGELEGHYVSLDRWRQARLGPVIWGIYRHRRLRDFDEGRPELSAITLLLPWIMLALDLECLAKADPRLDPVLATGSPIDTLVCDVLAEKTEASIVNAVLGELAGLIEAEEGAARLCRSVPLSAAADVRHWARESIPVDGDYWIAVGRSLERLTPNERGPQG